jgi:hypothetical protein
MPTERIGQTSKLCALGWVLRGVPLLVLDRVIQSGFAVFVHFVRSSAVKRKVWSTWRDFKSRLQAALASRL